MMYWTTILDLKTPIRVTHRYKKQVSIHDNHGSEFDARISTTAAGQK